MDGENRRTGQFITHEIQTFIRKSPVAADPTPGVHCRNQDTAEFAAATEEATEAVVEGLRLNPEQD